MSPCNTYIMMMMMMIDDDVMMMMCQDVCPTGHLFLGLASLAPLLLPGLMYSLATFLHYQVTHYTTQLLFI